MIGLTLKCFAVAISLAAAPASAPVESPETPAGAEPILAGPAKAGPLYVVRADGIAMRRHGRLVWLNRDQSADVAAAANVAGELHLFAAGANYRRYAPAMRGGTQGDLWDAALRDRAILAACAAADDTGLWLLLGPPVSQEPATKPADPVRSDVLVLNYDGRRWLDSIAVSEANAAEADRWLMAADDEGLSIMACKGGVPIAFSRLADGKWALTTHLRWGPSAGRVQRLVAVGRDWLLAGVGEQGLRLRAFDPTTGSPGEARAVTLKGQPFTQTPVAVDRSGSDLAVAWDDDGALQVGLIDIKTDSITAVVSLDDAPRGPSETQYLYLQWIPAIAAAALLAALFRRHRQFIERPFTLATGQLPSTVWIKRIVAFVVDFAPWLIVAVEMTGVDIEGFRELDLATASWRMLPTQGLAYAMHLVYAIGTEWFGGATLGKRVLGLRVVGPGGRPPSKSGIVIRNVTRLVELNCPLTPVFLLWPLFTRNRQRAGDMLAATAVVDRTYDAYVAAMDRPAAQTNRDDSADGSGPPPPPDNGPWQ